MKRFNKINGITLIALVVTIIILLILAGVSISALVGSGLINKARLSREKSEESAAREKIELKIIEYKSYEAQKNQPNTLEGLKEYFNNDEELEYIILYYQKISALTENLQTEIEGKALYGKIKLKQYKYEYTLDDNLKIVEIDDILIEEYYSNNKDNNDTDKEDDNDDKNDINTGIGDIDIIPSEVIEINDEEYDPICNIFNYDKGARVTYVTNPYGISATAINNGYTGNTTAIGNKTESFWTATNTWNVQGCVENDDSIANIKYSHSNNAKNANSSTCMSGTSKDKKVIIIDPRAYYGDTQERTYEIDELYLASANSDGDVGKYSVYISNGDTTVATNPDDSSWNFVTSGELTENGKLINVYNGNLKFKYIKIEVYARNCSYMELAAIKGFKRYTEKNTIKLAAKRVRNTINILATSGNSGIEKVQIEKPDGSTIEEKINFYRTARVKCRIEMEGIYKITAIAQNGEISAELEVNVTGFRESIYDYTGNLFNYNTGARVTYVTKPYNVSGTSINGGYTGSSSPIKNVTDGFWLPTNGWSVQGCLENDDSKDNIVYRHDGSAKSGSSSTCMDGGNTVKQTMIITPRAYYGDTIDYVFNANEIYMASANSDGDVGKFEIYSSSSNADISTNPDDSSWTLLTSGELTEDGKLTKVYDGNTKFRYLKLILYARNKGYMELAALKVF